MNEKGSVLLVSLIFLFSMVLISMAAIRFASVEQKVGFYFKDRQNAFITAKTVLLNIENMLESKPFIPRNYTTNCSKGLCFFGQYADDIANCQFNNGKIWLQDEVWNDAVQVGSVVFTDSNNKQRVAKYLIEFMCYIPKNPNGPYPDLANFQDWSPFFRITVMGFGLDNISRVMIQSTYKKKN